MAPSRLYHVTLRYGDNGRCAFEVERPRVVASPSAVPGITDLSGGLDAALATPLEFPPLEQAVLDDDRVVLALDPDAPGSAAMVAAVWRVLERRGVAAGNVLVLEPRRASGLVPPDPRGKLPPAVREEVGWKVHDPDRENARVYLASTAAGERIYLNRELVDADIVVSLGRVAYDPLVGCVGTSSVFYPGLSSRDAIRRSQGMGHDELGPNEERPLRQLMDEIGWLLGSQFTIQTIPASGAGVSHVLAGSPEAVLKRGRRLLAEHWLIEPKSRPEIVIASVDADAAGHGWEQVGAALAVARNLVARGGRIVILSELTEEPGDGIRMLRDAENPRDVLRPLQECHPSDLIPAMQLAAAADRARISFLSGLDSDLVDELFMTPLEEWTEAARLLTGDEKVAFLPSAQHMYGRVKP